MVLNPIRIYYFLSMYLCVPIYIYVCVCVIYVTLNVFHTRGFQGCYDDNLSGAIGFVLVYIVNYCKRTRIPKA